jgi:hypothetical protein
MVSSFLQNSHEKSVHADFLQKNSLPSHSEQKNDCPAWMILISSGSAGPDFLKWFKDF